MQEVLYIVSTPIGNLEDITIRAVRILKESDLILAEDTRTSSVLLKHLQIEKPLRSYHAHNEHKVVEEVVQLIKAGKKVALISDAGTPGISDPGFLLVRECLKNGLEVCTLPGATAFVPALVNSGFPTNEFSFYGFLPQKKGRQTRLKQVCNDEKTFVLYESPFRLLRLLEELKSNLQSERKICVSRELSKLHEENKRGSAQELIDHYTQRPPKGEIVIVVEGAGKHIKEEDE